MCRSAHPAPPPTRSGDRGIVGRRPGVAVLPEDPLPELRRSFSALRPASRAASVIAAASPSDLRRIARGSRSSLARPASCVHSTLTGPFAASARPTISRTPLRKSSAEATRRSAAARSLSASDSVTDSPGRFADNTGPRSHAHPALPSAAHLSYRRRPEVSLARDHGRCAHRNDNAWADRGDRPSPALRQGRFIGFQAGAASFWQRSPVQRPVGDVRARAGPGGSARKRLVRSGPGSCRTEGKTGRHRGSSRRWGYCGTT